MSRLAEYNRIGWIGDDELLANAHMKHESMDACIQVNLNTIREAHLDHPLTCYAVCADDNDIGFTVLMESTARLVYSFGINISWRNREILTRWLAAIDDKFAGERYGVTLFKVNSRAIKFFRRNGFVQQQEIDKNILLWR